MTLSITAPGSANLKSNLDGGEHVVVHSEDTTQRAALLAALAALDPDVGLAAVVTALGGTLAISASALPLPAGAATQTTLAALLAKIIAAPATEAKQDAGNTALGLLATQTTAAAILAKLSADPATQTTLAAVLAKMIAAPATEAKQDTNTAAVALVGTRAHGTPAARVAVAGTTAYSTAITATEVLLHASTRCFVQAVAGTGTPAVTTDAIPLEIGEKFYLRITSGQRIGVIQDTAAGFLNVVPVA
jgi:hypothetical protein